MRGAKWRQINDNGWQQELKPSAQLSTESGKGAGLEFVLKRKI
jgi:hypothetical protein